LIGTLSSEARKKVGPALAEGSQWRNMLRIQDLHRFQNPATLKKAAQSLLYPPTPAPGGLANPLTWLKAQNAVMPQFLHMNWQPMCGGHGGRA
jgi:hypothetical protein